MNPQILDIGNAAPDLSHQGLVGQHASGMPDQRPQDLIFARRQLDLVVAKLHHPPHQRSTDSSPTLNTGFSPCSCSRWRSATLMRAINSFMLNGFVT